VVPEARFSCRQRAKLSSNVVIDLVRS
jgi:hypothetical protein